MPGILASEERESFMALVKKAALGKRGRVNPTDGADEVSGTGARAKQATSKPTFRAKRRTQGSTILDRLDQATEELAGGLGQAAAAVAQLQRTVEDMSSSAEEAAGAAQESLGLIGHLRSNFRDANLRASASLTQTQRLQASFVETANQIDASVASIELNASRQLGSIAIIEQLEVATGKINAIGETVSDLAEQTGILALNAAIEATRAGENGKGFAIVADEVRELSENAEANASDVRALANGIASEVRLIAERVRLAGTVAATEASNGKAVATALARARADLGIVQEGAVDIASAATQSESAATEAERGAEQVASAAEEQSSAAAEAQQAVEQQATSLEESQQTAEALGELNVALQEASDIIALEQIATAAEELSATVQQLSGASAQIQIAIEQIARGAQLQSAATLQASSAMGQIETGASLASARASEALDRLDAIVHIIGEGSINLGQLVQGVSDAVTETRAVLGLLATLGETARRVEKIVDALGLSALQTNMLGVSGAVEATRAGDAGQGFATVTVDIRKLARALAANAEDGKDVVREIQDQIALIRRDLDQIAGAGEAEAGRNRALVDRFAVMSGELDATRADNKQILDGAQAIQRATREVRSGCDQIAKAAELASEAAREAGATAQQQAQAAESLAAAIEDIASLAESLTLSAQQPEA